MADKKISALTGATTPLAGTEVLPIVQSGSTKQVSIENLTKGRTVNGASFDTDVAAAGVTLSGTTLAADGTDANINVNITPKGAGLTNSNGISRVTVSEGPMQELYSTSTSILTDSRVAVTNIYGSDGGAAVVAYQDWRAENNHATNSRGVSLVIGLATPITQTATDVLKLKSNGDIVMLKSGSGVNFTANTPAAGMTSRLLNWYEEGTWTPSLGGNTTYTFQEGFYTRIGRLITVSGIITVNSIGTGSTTQISGIPFNVAQNGSGSSSYFNNLATSVVSLVPYVDANSTVLKFRTLTAAATGMSSSAIFQNGTRVDFTITYSV